MNYKELTADWEIVTDVRGMPSARRVFLEDPTGPLTALPAPYAQHPDSDDLEATIFRKKKFGGNPGRHVWTVEYLRPDFSPNTSPGSGGTRVDRARKSVRVQGELQPYKPGTAGVKWSDNTAVSGDVEAFLRGVTMDFTLTTEVDNFPKFVGDAAKLVSKVNKNTFMGAPPGTLYFSGAEIDEQQRPKADNPGSVETFYPVRLQFIFRAFWYLDGTTEAIAGWQHLLRPTDMKWLKTTPLAYLETDKFGTLV